jgi:hypothetical protein
VAEAIGINRITVLDWPRLRRYNRNMEIRASKEEAETMALYAEAPLSTTFEKLLEEEKTSAPCLVTWMVNGCEVEIETVCVVLWPDEEDA